ncbi:type IV secretion system protein [Pelomonas sp. Root1444]|uniref:type IV secretion system protein n=1 Tax=Pelomonas sp. Root1444 TaxID=1736464 RepID=UPI0007030ADE|nr:type IV secretion system protein [Pelomonas sp. Root1444]KQY88252.1 conjugal transfer protein TrbL [Pelomonas sp. Root1444]
MFTWVGSQFENVLDTYCLGVVSRLMGALAPIALATLTLWVALYGWAVLRNEVSDTVPTFMWKAFKIGLVLALSLESGLYITNIADTANALATGVATTFLPSTAGTTMITSPYAILDAFNDKASQLVVDLLKEAGITRLDLLFAAVVTAFANVVFLCIALFVVTLSKVFLTFVIAIGPVFVLALAWRPTARFFDSWLSVLLNAVVLTWFAFFALGLSAYMGGTLVQTIQDQGGFVGPTFNPVAESLKYCIVMILMSIICFQAPSLASALTGGAAIQQGIQMIQNVMMVSGLRSRSGPSSSGATAGGTVRAGTGVSYAAGRAAGAAGAAVSAARGVASGARAPARDGTEASRVPSYNLAAMRDQS